jgi:hypothetical protein
LRTVRSGLKTGPRPAPSEATEQFRSHVKTLELAAEKLENKLLVECLPLRPQEKETVRLEQLRTVLENVVSFFAERPNTAPKANLASSIDTMVEAAIPDAT